MKKFKTKLKKFSLFDRILIAIAVLGIASFAYLFFRKSSYIAVTIKVSEESIFYDPWRVETGTKTWFSQLFYQGMKEQDGLGGTTAEVLSIKSYDTLPSHKAVYLSLKIKSVFNRASNQYTFKGRPVLIGSTVRLYLDRLLVDGLVTHVEGVKDLREKETLIIEAQIQEESPVFFETSGTSKHIADALKIGEEIKDDQGNTVIKVLNKRVENAKRTVITSDGRIIVGTNPLRKDVYLTLQVEALKIHDKYFLFEDIPLLVGEEIPINSSTVSIQPEVTEIRSFE